MFPTTCLRSIRTIRVRAYHERVIEHYDKPKNVGKFTKEEVESGSVGTGVVGAPACGDVMKLQLKIEDGVVVDAKFKTFGCGSAIASRFVRKIPRLTVLVLWPLNG